MYFAVSFSLFSSSSSICFCSVLASALYLRSFSPSFSVLLLSWSSYALSFSMSWSCCACSLPSARLLSLSSRNSR